MTVVKAATCAVLLGSLAVGRAHAQHPVGLGQDSVSASIRQKHMVHVSPHLIVLDPVTESATLAFSNVGDAPTEADVVLQLGYTTWQNTDTVLFSPNWAQEAPHDTVLADPGPRDHYLGQWVSGLPNHLVLQPHQTEQVTVRIHPPPDLPNGEYYARIVTMAKPYMGHDTGKSHDTRSVYAIPIVGHSPPPIRDSVRVFYRQGPQSMGITFPFAVAKIDTSDLGSSWGLGSGSLYFLVRVHLTGTAHFEGYESDYFVTAHGERIGMRVRMGAAFTIHSDGILRRFVETDMLPPGHYTFVFRLIGSMDEFPATRQLPMDTATVSMPVEIK